MSIDILVSHAPSFRFPLPRPPFSAHSSGEFLCDFVTTGPPYLFMVQQFLFCRGPGMWTGVYHLSGSLWIFHPPPIDRIPSLKETHLSLTPRFTTLAFTLVTAHHPFPFFRCSPPVPRSLRALPVSSWTGFFPPRELLPVACSSIGVKKSQRT